MSNNRSNNRQSSLLVDETFMMEQTRREAEQEGHRKLARVHVREHSEAQASPEGELQNSIQEHPWFNSQRYDGVDSDTNPLPPLNTDARREYDNAKREQQLELQMRLGLMPKMGSTPEPKP
ncbi:hypothetical protein [Legionella fairfieldensis]|uniref:hypothetical protein n=1 Tax=Legionella fairfieldensis TaxID=45064 RepID=UPI001041663D|nr:hypothetical protein [Legionella fairfieldensis]